MNIFKLIIAILLMTAGTIVAGGQEIDFIQLGENHIQLNGDDWSGLRSKIHNLASCPGGKFNIVQIGDSHIQPGILTDQVRTALQRAYGNGGRGLIAPLALAGTNEPRDYVIRSTASVTSKSRLMSRTWPVENGLTGVSVQFGGERTDLTLVAKHNEDAFSNVTLFHAPREGYESARVGDDVVFARQSSPYTSQFTLQSATGEVTLAGLPCAAPFYGAYLLNNRRGVVVSEIGNNGATCALYNKVDNWAAQLKLLQPQLVIISLGTNEAYGNPSAMATSLDRLVRNIKQQMPAVKILLVTPVETQKGNGRTGTARVREIILDYGRRNHIAVWDMYQVCGGQGSSSQWLNMGLMNNADKLHQLEPGYTLQGMLLGDALLEAFK